MTPTRVRALLAAAALGAGLGVAPADPPADADKAKALKLNDLTDTKSMQAKLDELVKDKAEARRLAAAGAAVLKAAKPGGDPPFTYNAAIVLAKAAHSAGEAGPAGALYEAAVDAAAKVRSGGKLQEAFEGAAALYQGAKNWAALEELAAKVYDAADGPAAEEIKVEAAQLRVEAKAKQGNVDDAVRDVEGLIQAYDRDGLWYFRKLKGAILRDAGRTDEAIGTFEEVLDRIADAKRVKPDVRKVEAQRVRYVLSGLYVDANQVDKAADNLKALMQEAPDDPTFPNDLGYIWADNGKNLAESEKLIRKALELDEAQRKKLLEAGKIDEAAAARENGAFLDSMGWVLFKQKRYADAKPYLEKAVKDDRDPSLEVWDHLADCLAALGEKAEAAAAWEKGLKQPDRSPRDKDRRKKVVDKLAKLKADLGK